jgi:FkbM family methyltransferase
LKGSDKRFSFFRGKLDLIQPEEHKVSVDLILFLSKAKGIKRSSKVADLGAGFGFLSVVIAKKFGCRVIAVERDERLYNLLRENIKINLLESLITPLKGDIRRIEELIEKGSVDVVITNPPFYPREYGVRDGGFHFEEDTKLEDFIVASSRILRDGGYFNLLIPAFRLHESFSTMGETNLPPRFLSIVYPKPSKGGRLSIVSSIKNVPGPLSVEKAIFINREEGGYTREVESLLDDE